MLVVVYGSFRIAYHSYLQGLSRSGKMPGNRWAGYYFGDDAGGDWFSGR